MPPYFERGALVCSQEAIFDIGLLRNATKSKVYAFLKGVVDSGVEMKFDEKKFPSEDRIKGKNMKNKIEFEEIKEKIEK